VEQEGVIQFAAQHSTRDLPLARHGTLVNELGAWRRIFVQTGLLGADASRYGGFGFGNLSGRVAPLSQARGSRGFLITGSQTGAKESLSIADYALVRTYSIRTNTVESEGLSLPSSESMTHGAFYDLSPALRFVFHVHAPAIWERARALRIPTSCGDIAYGTPQMAAEVARLYRTSSLAETRILAMGGHVDGIIGFGRSASEAGLAIMSILARAYEINS
tara:strand:+ start:159975 stop:160631 length:657 start_codon:yes stop_codon:yes gene_type:complete